MARSDVFFRLSRTLRIARWCDGQGLPSREGVERATDLERRVLRSRMSVVFSTRLAIAIAVLGLSYAIASSLQDGSWRANSVNATILGRPWANFNDPGPTLAAARRLRDNPEAPLYEGVYLVGASFLYPPLAAWLHVPIVAFEDPETALLRFNQAAFVAIALMAAWLARPAGLWAAALAGASAIAFYPLTRAVELNQASILVTAAMGVAFIAADRGRAALAGVPLAAAVAIKPHLALILPIVVWQSPRMVLGAAVAGAALLGVSVAVAGLDDHVTYITEIVPALGNGYAFFPNQSWNGLLNRMVHDDMAQFVLAPESDVVRVGTIVLGLATIGTAMVVARRSSDRPLSFLLGLAWIAVTMASPIAWEHHYGPALFLFAIWLRERVRAGADFRSFDLAFAFAWVTISNYFEVRHLERASALLASYVFAGGIVLASMFAWAWRVGTRLSAVFPVSGRAWSTRG